jgi:hypothetical protein
MVELDLEFEVWNMDEHMGGTDQKEENNWE